MMKILIYRPCVEIWKNLKKLVKYQTEVNVTKVHQNWQQCHFYFNVRKFTSITSTFNNFSTINYQDLSKCVLSGNRTGASQRATLTVQNTQWHKMAASKIYSEATFFDIPFTKFWYHFERQF